MDAQQSFLRRPGPVKRQQSVSNLANRSHSIAAVLKAVESGKGHLVSSDAYLPSPFRGGGGGGDHGGGHSQQTQEQLFRASSFVQNTSYYDEEMAAAEKRREMDRNVVLFPRELRGENRFFNSADLGHKAAALVQDSRRPSSLFSNGISSSCREELNIFQRVKRYENIKLLGGRRSHTPQDSGGVHQHHQQQARSRTVSPTGGGGKRKETTTTATSAVFRPLDENAFGDVVDEEVLDGDREDDPFLAMPMLLHRSRGHDDRGNERRPFSSNEPQFLVHVDEDDREEISERDKFGRRVEYGRMVGMFREEVLASRVNRHTDVPRHPEVEGRRGRGGPEAVLDWSHMDLIDPVLLMDVLPRGGIVLIENPADGTETKKVLTGSAPPTAATRENRSSRGKQHSGGRTSSARPRSGGAESSTTVSTASGAPPPPGRRASTPAANGDTGHRSGRAPTPSDSKRAPTPNDKIKQQNAVKELSHRSRPPLHKATDSGVRGKKKRDSPPKNSLPGRRASLHNANNSTTSHNNARDKKNDSGGGVGAVTISEPMPWENTHKSPIWQLKYCFCDEDAEEIIQVQKKMVVVESGGEKYAFDPTKKHISRDLDAESETMLSPAKRERLRWLRMTPAEREARRIHNLLSCGKSYQGRHVNLSNNLLCSVDVMLTNTLAVLLRQNVTKLDLSFNRIQTLDWSFLHVSSTHEAEERKRRTMQDAEDLEEEQMRNATLSHGGLLSDAQTQKQRDAFLKLRRRAVQDLVETSAPHKLFYHLQTLYLHGNPLRDISELWKLEPLRLSLAYLTFHGEHHVDVQAKDPKHRAKLLATFPKLVQVNFTTLLPGDEDALW